MTFSLGHESEHGLRVRLNHVRDVHSVYHAANFADAGVMVVMMVLMQVLVLFLAVDRHADVQAGDAALLVLRAGDLSPAAEQGVHALHIALGLGSRDSARP